MLGSLWGISIKVPNLEQELEFHRKLGNKIMNDFTLEVEGESFRIVLVSARDNLCLAEKPTIERLLGLSLPYGVTHLVYLGGHFDEPDKMIDQVTAADGTLLWGPAHLEGTNEYGSRAAAFFRAPGGCIFEVFSVEEWSLIDWVFWPWQTRNQVRLRVDFSDSVGSWVLGPRS